MDTYKLFPEREIDPPKIFLTIEYQGRGCYAVWGQMWHAASSRGSARFQYDRLTLEEALSVVEAVTDSAYAERED